MTKQEQMVEQLKAVAHLGNAIGKLYEELALVYSSVPPRDGVLLDVIGNRTASMMEALGDMLNATDSAVEDDEWLTPIFEEAHRIWPQSNQQ